jgi:hypothetical protein
MDTAAVVSRLNLFVHVEDLVGIRMFGAAQ